MIANGFCPWAVLMRCTESRRGCSGLPSAKRLFPARSRASASSGVFGRGLRRRRRLRECRPDEPVIDSAPAASVPPCRCEPAGHELPPRRVYPTCTIPLPEWKKHKESTRLQRTTSGRLRASAPPRPTWRRTASRRRRRGRARCGRRRSGARRPVPRTCMAASAKRIMPEAPIGLDDSTPPEQLTGRSPSIAVAPSSVIFQPSPSARSRGSPATSARTS